MDKNLLQKAKAPMIALILFNFIAFSVIAKAQTYGGGSGWEEDPYIISTTDHLDQLAATVNSGGSIGGGYFRLDADLDYSGKTYTPIGRYVGPSVPGGYYSFDGVFDGNGHTIYNVTINSNVECVGLFGALTGTVKNLTLGLGSTINGSGWYTGGIVGRMSSFSVGDTDRGIRNCVVSEGVTITGGGSCTGGILGYYGSNHHVNGNLCLATVSGSGFVGGIIGSNGIDDRVVGNYYANPCNVGGINGNDLAGKAEMAYALTFSAEYSSNFICPSSVTNAIVHNNKVYAPAETEVSFSKYAYSTLGSVARYDFSGGTSVTLQREVVLTMPASDVTATVTREFVWEGASRTISTSEGLDLLAYWVAQGNNFENKTFNLNADLDYTGLSYQPIGRFGYVFCGVFYGNNHTISGIDINGTENYQGVFGYFSGEVHNLKLENSVIQGNGYLGGIAGCNNNGTVRNCVVGENVSVDGNNYVGGIVGYVSNGTVEDNLFVGSVSGSGSSTGSIIGSESIATVNRNYYIGSCTVGGIEGSDEPGRAERAYSFTIQATETATATYQYPTALDNAVVFDGQYYAPNGAEVGLPAFAYIEDGLVARYSATIGTIVPQQRGALLTMQEGTVTVMATPEDVWNGNREISTIEGLDLFSHKVKQGNKYEELTFNLEADLDYTGLSFEPIGSNVSAKSFCGMFNGNNHTISGININGTENYQGVFGYLSGEVHNLKLENSIIQGNNYLGGIAGRCNNIGTVSNCVVSENVSIIGDRYIGGVVGSVYQSGTVKDNLSFASVTGNTRYCGSVIGYKSSSSVASNNYYSGTSTYGGIENADVLGEAMRGYAIEPQQPLGISLEGSIGVFYDGKVYAGENQVAIVGFEVTGSSIVPQCLTLSAGTYTDNGDGTYTITMPAEDITVSDNIVVEFYGTYYEIPCNGGTTATVIYDISYDTLDYVGIEDFEYGGIQYTVTAIADGAFDGLDNLMGIYCHSNISTIGDFAFRNCTGIDYFGFYRTHTPPTLGEGVFEGLHIDTLSITVPFCSQYDYDQHAVFGQFGEIFGNEACEYNFYNEADDNQWSNPANWRNADYETCTEAPGADARVAIFADCEMDAEVTVGSITIGNYYDEEYGYYERLTVKDGATLTATSFIYNSGDARNLIIEDGAQVIHPNTGAQATVEKNITAYTPNSKNGWHLVSSPAIESFAPTADNGFLANEYDLYYYHEPTHYWRNHKDDTNNADPGFGIEPLKGYLYANNANDTLQLQGILRTAMETVNFPLSYTDGIALAGFNLVGNPFAHNVTSFTGSNVATEVYRMNEAKDEVAVGTLSENNPLKPGEGFFVKAMGDDASITFNSRATNAERSLNLSKGRITLEVSENSFLVDRFILKRDGEPLEKFTLNENGTKVYATEGAQDWAVAVIASEAKQSSPTEQPINFKAANNGTYTLTVNIENMDLDYLHLIDNLTGADVDLLQTPVYTFTAKTTDYASRFCLVFSICGDANGDNDGNDAPFAYINNGEIVITADAGDAQLQIVDMMGRIIVSCGGHTRCVPTSGMPADVYVLRLIDGDSVRTQKIVIQ